MIITRKNPVGGKPLRKGSFNLHSDRGGNFGYLIGYVPENAFTGDKILLSLENAEDFMKAMNVTWLTFFERNQPRETMGERFKRTVVYKLGGQIVDN